MPPMELMASPEVLAFLGVRPQRARGARQSTGLVPAPPMKVDVAQRLLGLLQLGDERPAYALVGMRERTYQRRRAADDELTPAEKDILMRSARLVMEAERVFGDRERAVRWLKTPSAILGSAPISVMTSDAGAKAVEQELTRIQWGDYA